jgi:glutamate-5-semialdehyde dehydrogenase
MDVLSLAKECRLASQKLLASTEDQRTRALAAMAYALEQNVEKILKANAIDLDEGQKQNLSAAMMDRLKLTEKSIKALSEMCLSVAGQKQVVGEIVEEYTRPNGLIIQKQRIPLGVIGMIFESRPNVVVDGAALAIKSGNAIILKGGKEAQFSNRALFEVIYKSLQEHLPLGTIGLIETREDVIDLLKLNQYIDLMVPRGGSALINFVRKHATMPVVAHDKGLCHLFVDETAITEHVIPIVLNAKVQRPGVCNALESLLVHEKYPHKKEIIDALLAAGVEVRGCEKTQKLATVKAASAQDYQTEWLDKVISVKIVDSIDEAINHIQEHSSHHTESILTQDDEAIEKFLNSLDASCLMVNTSTRFNDGGELGLGAELGISTSKLHAYGPMGAKEMTTTRFIVKGRGQIR